MGKLLKRLDRDKRSSLFGLLVGDEEKMLKTLTPGAVVIKFLWHYVTLVLNTLECLFLLRLGLVFIGEARIANRVGAYPSGANLKVALLNLFRQEIFARDKHSSLPGTFLNSGLGKVL